MAETWQSKIRLLRMKYLPVAHSPPDVRSRSLCCRRLKSGQKSENLASIHQGQALPTRTGDIPSEIGGEMRQVSPAFTKDRLANQNRGYPVGNRLRNATSLASTHQGQALPTRTGDIPSEIGREMRQVSPALTRAALPVRTGDIPSQIRREMRRGALTDLG
jgi:hypothetical protein